MSASPALTAGPDQFAERLVAWQRKHGRHDLPWQASRDPYRVWLSEIMLQQTQVSVVLGRFEPFLQRFPTLRSLAEADLDAVLAQWSGLGYYRRARHLHQCARQVWHEHAGQFPGTQQDLQRLAGIGRSTAAAIAAFCFGARAAILDGNVKRVLKRAFDLPETVTDTRLWTLAEHLLPVQDLDAYTQGLMDLGATICKPAHPDCGACPFATDCHARLHGRTDAARARPRPAPRPRRAQAWVLLLARRGDAVWLERRDGLGIWPDLWCLPRHDDRAQALAQAQAFGEVLAQHSHPTRVHALTHLDLRLDPIEVTLADAPMSIEDTAADAGWFRVADALALGLPAPIRTLLTSIDA